MNQTITFDPNVVEFKAGDKIYYRSDELSIDRYMLEQKLFVRVAITNDFPTLARELVGLKTVFDEVVVWRQKGSSDFHAAVDNILVGLTHIDKELPLILQFCTLFWNTKDEDVRYMSGELMKAKVQDWIDAGISMSFFEGFYQLQLNRLLGD